MSKVIPYFVVGGLITLFAFNIKTLAFYVGVVMGYIDSMFNTFSYLGASCTAISTILSGVSAGLILFIFIKLYNFLKD